MITLIEVKKDNVKLLDNLLQLYLHDVSAYFPIDFDSSTCRYLYDPLDKYFDETGNFAFLFMEDDNVIGFTLIDSVDNGKVVQEMFILNNYKGNHLGSECITKVFDKFKGEWTIKSLPCSSRAENFWIRVVNEYTKGDYKLERIGKYDRTVLKFTNN